MSDAFRYRPKFVDIRVKKSGAGAKARESDGPPCDHIGCPKAGEHRAPKGRDHVGEFWHFCLEHVTEYNKRWNYFSGMTEEELAAYQRAEETGHRPTWSFRASKDDRLSAAMRNFQAGRRADPYGMFDGGGQATAPAAAPQKRLTRLQTLALEAMHLDERAEPGQIRARYAELVKRYHPDSNGGERGAEEQLDKVVKAYQVLKSGGLV